MNREVMFACRCNRVGFAGTDPRVVLLLQYHQSTCRGHTPMTTSRDRKKLSNFSIAPTSADKAEGQTGATAYTFTVTRTGATDVAHSVNWSVSGIAVTGADFVGGLLPGGVLSFAAGETSKIITVNVAADTIIEKDEAFTVTLSNPGPGAAITTASATGIIRNDDATAIIWQNSLNGDVVSWSIANNAIYSSGFVGSTGVNPPGESRPMAISTTRLASTSSGKMQALVRSTSGPWPITNM